MVVKPTAQGSVFLRADVPNPHRDLVPQPFQPLLHLFVWISRNRLECECYEPGSRSRHHLCHRTRKPPATVSRSAGTAFTTTDQPIHEFIENGGCTVRRPDHCRNDTKETNEDSLVGPLHPTTIVPNHTESGCHLCILFTRPPSGAMILSAYAVQKKGQDCEEYYPFPGSNLRARQPGRLKR